MTAPTVTTAASLYALDAAYRAATARTSLAVAKALQLRWTSVQPDDLAGTSLAFLSDAVELVLAGQRLAAGNANEYARRVRALSVPSAPAFTPPDPRPPSVEQIRTSVEYTGIRKTAIDLSRIEATTKASQEDPAADRESIERTDAGAKQRIMQEGLRRAASTAARLVTSAGHDQIYDIVQADPVALGWARTTKPGCCFFCAMLASRGFVYKKDSFSESDARFHGPGQHKVHDTCGCGLRPGYRVDDYLPERAQELEDLWVDSQRQRRQGETAINAFRRIYSASPLAQPAVAA